MNILNNKRSSTSNQIVMYRAIPHIENYDILLLLLKTIFLYLASSKVYNYKGS